MGVYYSTESSQNRPLVLQVVPRLAPPSSWSLQYPVSKAVEDEEEKVRNAQKGVKECFPCQA